MVDHVLYSEFNSALVTPAAAGNVASTDDQATEPFNLELYESWLAEKELTADLEKINKELRVAKYLYAIQLEPGLLARPIDGKYADIHLSICVYYLVSICVYYLRGVVSVGNAELQAVQSYVRGDVSAESAEFFQVWLHSL